MALVPRVLVPIPRRLSSLRRLHIFFVYNLEPWEDYSSTEALRSSFFQDCGDAKSMSLCVGIRNSSAVRMCVCVYTYTHTHTPTPVLLYIPPSASDEQADLSRITCGYHSRSSCFIGAAVNISFSKRPLAMDIGVPRVV